MGTFQQSERWWRCSGSRWRLPECGRNGCNYHRAPGAPYRYNGAEFREVPAARFVTEYLEPDFRFAGSLTVRDERVIQGDDPSVIDDHRPVFNVAVLVVREDVNWAVGAGRVAGTWQPFDGEAAGNLGLAVDEGLIDEFQGASGLAGGLRLGPFGAFSVTAGFAYESAVSTESR